MRHQYTVSGRERILQELDAEEPWMNGTCEFLEVVLRGTRGVSFTRGALASGIVTFPDAVYGPRVSALITLLTTWP